MTLNNPNIELVIAVLKGLEIDGETMQHIINEVGMTDQMKKQLGGPATISQAAIDDLAADITKLITREGTDAISSYDLSIDYSNRVELDNVDFDEDLIQRVVTDALAEHFQIEVV